MVKSFKYLGVDILPSLYSTITKNFQGTLSRVEADMKKWSLLPISPQARISILKMDILPRITPFTTQGLLGKDSWSIVKIHLER